MSLTTPEKIRSLQRKLYCKAKAEPAFRFYVLYDKVCREDILLHAYRLARANAGAPGVDGVTFATIEERGLEAWLTGLREDLVLKRYRPDPVRRVMIPKASGDGERSLGIPTVRDRVVQTAAKIVLEPIFEGAGREAEPTWRYPRVASGRRRCSADGLAAGGCRRGVRALLGRRDGDLRTAWAGCRSPA